MSRRTLALPIAIMLAGLTALTALAAAPRLEKLTTTPQAPSALADVVGEGYRVMGTDAAPLAEVWLRKDLPASGAKAVDGANYPQFRPSELIGIINFPKSGKDFRGQPIKPGTYTLRYELLPADGNHMGVAPDRDFLLLVPAAEDPGPGTLPKYEELIKLSTRASGTNHPAAFSMVAADSRPLPAAYTDPNDYLIFAARMKTSTGELPVAIIVKGVSMSF